MDANEPITTDVPEVLVERIDTSKDLPAPGADDKKPTDGETAKEAESPDSPASGAEDDKPEAETAQEAAKRAERKLSRRERAVRAERDRAVAAETEARLLREQLAQLKTPQAEAPKEPKREDFESYEAFLEARQDWRMDQREATRKAEDAKRAPEAPQMPEGERKRADAWMEREKTVEKADKDYQSDVNAFLDTEEWRKVSQGARSHILDSELGPQLLRHLARSEEDAERIADLPPTRQIIELGKLEDKLAKPGKKETSAPAPATHQRSGVNGADGFRENMSQKEYEAMRKSQGSPWLR